LVHDAMIPRTMSTQHPDNARVPDWCGGSIIEGDAEVREAFLAFSSLGCDEAMWDSEGKDIDTNVVRKLLSDYPDYFRDNVIGERVFLTYRIPNPRIEVAERKIVTQTLQTIPLSADVASLFHKRKTIPVFEVILPFTTTGKELLWLHEYYRRAISGAEGLRLDGSIVVKDWVGSFRPKTISVIPLIEDMRSLLAIDQIAREYIERVRVRSLRVFIARSDPALNYGLLSAVILSKLALSKLGGVERRTGVRIHPIIGVGSMPFRGHLNPENVERFLMEYKGLSTATTQSALRYDHSPEKVKRTIRILNENLPNGEPVNISKEDEELLRGSLDKFKASYQKRIEELAALINALALYVPERRARKLHIGLFGYSRSVRSVRMPRAIPFAAVFYSMGIPPEFIGVGALRDLSEKEWKAVESCYLNMKHDLGVAGKYVSWESINMLMEMNQRVAKRAAMDEEKLRAGLGRLMSDLAVAEELLSIRLGPSDNVSRRHENFINNFLISYLDNEDDDARVAFIEAAMLRRCLG